MLCGVMILLAGCATGRINWEGRVGHYTFDEAVREMGPPDKSAVLSDGTRVAEWLTVKGRRMNSLTYIGGGSIPFIPQADWPDYYARLTFDTEGRLTAYKEIAK